MYAFLQVQHIVPRPSLRRRLIGNSARALCWRQTQQFFTLRVYSNKSSPPINLSERRLVGMARLERATSRSVRTAHSHLLSYIPIEPYRGVEPQLTGWKPGVLAVRPVRQSGSPRARTSRLRHFTPLLYPDELENRSLARRDRTSDLMLPKHAPYRSAMASQWTAPGSNREPSPCRGVALPIGASSPWAARPGTTRAAGAGPRRRGRNIRAREAAACLFLWCFRCAVVNTLARSPRGVVLRMDGRNRTCNHWFWGPALSLVELRP